MFLSKYGEARHIYVPMIKRGVVDFAVGADWTPAAGDVKISKDGGAAANVTNLPAAIAMGNTAMWDFSLSAAELQAAQIKVTVADSATKAVEDQMIVIETYGNAGAQHAFDLDTASTAQTGDVFPLASTEIAEIKAKTDNLPSDPADQSLIIAATDAVMARLGAPVGASHAADVAAVKTDSAATYAQVTHDEWGLNALMGRFNYGVSVIGTTPDAAAQNADALLDRSIAGGANGGRTVRSAFRAMRNRRRVAAGYLTVYEENDVTVDHTAVVITAPGNPITEIDPA